MITLFYYDSYDKLINFVFEFYDKNNDKYVTKEDIKLVLSYIPLQLPKSKDFMEKFRYVYDCFSGNFKDRKKSQNETLEVLEKAFGEKTKINLDEFNDIIENTCSEIFLLVLI